MQNANYNVKRENVFIGTVAVCAIDKNKELLINDRAIECRSMIFVIDDRGYADDLLYNSPSYPVVGKTDKNIFLIQKDNFIAIKNTKSLGKLLEKIGYKDNLSIEDIENIRQTIFSGYFFKKNCDLLGIVAEKSKIPPHNTIYKKIKSGFIPDEYSLKMDDYGDTYFNSTNYTGRVKDNFQPSEKEEKITKLQ